MADELTAPDADPAIGADGNAGQAPPQEAAAEQVPAWAASLIETNKQLRQGISTLGAKVKDLGMREQPYQAAPAYEQPYYPPAQDPWAQGGDSQTVADMTQAQIRAMMQQEANTTAYQMAAHIAQTYGLDAIPRQRAVSGVNAYLAEQGHDPIPADALQRVAPQVEQILEQLGASATPASAAWVAQSLIQQSQATAERSAAADRQAQTAQANAVSGAVNNVQTGTHGSPPPPGGPQTQEDAKKAYNDAFMKNVMAPGLQDPPPAE